MENVKLGNETEQAVTLANKVLDRHNADPDDDLAVLARQFLRAREARRYWLLERTNRATRKQMYIAVNNFQLDWVDSIDEALQLARRKDADDLCNIVEDATQVIEHRELAESENQVLIEQSGPVCAGCRRPVIQTFHPVKPDWLPSPENINALPDPIRKHVLELRAQLYGK